MNYSYNKDHNNWESLLRSDLGQRYGNVKAKVKCPFCESVLSYCSMRSHVYTHHSHPEQKTKPERVDKLPTEVKLARRKEYNDKYREEHKEIIKQKFKETYEANKAVINKQHECKCGKLYVLKHKARHEQSKHHQEFLKQ